MTTTQEALYALPPDVQEQLLRIARLAAGMSPGEKAEARGYFGTLALIAAVGGVPDDQVPSAEMVSALGRIVAKLDELATTGRKD